tara:strand:+ start:9966 stop:10799 length:834 start_codon:yes stop_codon:yes gene_type:complete
MIDRNEMLEEVLLRENIRKAIKMVKNKRLVREQEEEVTLRKVIRGMLLEKTPVADDTPHEKTGINVLRRTLKKVIPQIKDDYMSLTTDEAQRTSYIAHLVNGVDNLLAPIETTMDAPDPSPHADLEEDIGIEVGDADEDDKFIDIGDMGMGAEEEEEELPDIDDDEATMTRGMEAAEHDETGRNVALGTFKQIQGTIVDDFSELANDEDRELYHDYLKTNILLWRDKFEDSLSSNLPEPTTPEYERERGGGKPEEQPPMMEVKDNDLLDLSNLSFII